MKQGTIKAGDLVVLRPDRADAYGMHTGPYTVIDTRKDTRYRKDWITLACVDGVICSTDVRAVVPVWVTHGAP